jgi:hypothetical protein
VTAGSATAHGFCCVLPASGVEVELFHPTGREDLLLLEVKGGDAEAALALAARLARTPEGAAVDFAALPVGDLDAALVRLRQMLLGDRVRSDVTCPNPGCGARIDISFGLGDYLEHRRPRAPALRAWEVAPCADAPGWFRLARRTAAVEEPVRFRLPAAGDERAAADRPDAADELARRCVRPAGRPARLRRAAEAAMEALAPSLSSELSGVCPDCATEIRVHFDARRYCLQELRTRAAGVLADVDTLAQRYHWSEQAILEMPSVRRASYAELARERSVA